VSGERGAPWRRPKGGRAGAGLSAPAGACSEGAGGGRLWAGRCRGFSGFVDRGGAVGGRRLFWWLRGQRQAGGRLQFYCLGTDTMTFRSTQGRFTAGGPDETRIILARGRKAGRLPTWAARPPRQMSRRRAGWSNNGLGARIGAKMAQAGGTRVTTDNRRTICISSPL